jgi:uncharacterized RDD family membrane protein YckC
MPTPLKKWKYLTAIALLVSGLGISGCIQLGRWLQDHDQNVWGAVVGLGGGVAWMWMMSRVRRRYLRELRRVTPQPTATLADAGTDTVLLLRGFDPERRATSDHVTDTGWNRKRLRVSRRPVEAALLALFGARVITVANPGDPDPIEGSVRVTVNPARWRDDVADLISRAHAIVVHHSSNSEGLKEEAALIRSLGAVDKTLIIVGARVATENDEFKVARVIRDWWSGFPRLFYLARTFAESEEYIDQIELARRIRRGLDGVIDAPLIAYKPARLWDRIAAAPVELLPSIFGVALVQSFVLLIVVGILSLLTRNRVDSDRVFKVIAMWVAVSSWPIYLIRAESQSGQPFGKSDKQLRVLTMVEGKLSLSQAILRTVIKFASLLVPGSLAWLAMTRESLSLFVAAVLTAAGLAAVSWFTEERRLLHDLASGARVVSTLALREKGQG